MKKGLMIFLMAAAVFLGSTQKAQAINLGPFRVGVQFCEQVQRLAPLLNVYSMVQWPVLGFPGITFGLSQNTSALLDFCDFIMQIEQLDTQDAIFFAGNYLNKLTDNKWGHHLTMADKTWNLANTVYDFESGQYRKGALTSVQTHRDINDFIGESYSWYNKTMNGKDVSLQTRGQREQDMNAFANTAYRRAILAEALSCPAGNTANGQKDYDKIYTNEIKPQEIIRDESKDDVEFFRSKLLDMGPRFMNNQGELQTYIAEVEKLMSQGVNYKVAIKKKTETTTKPGKAGADGKPVPQKVNVTKDTQVFTVQMFSDMFNKFKGDWSEKWSSYVTTAFLSAGSQGLLTDPQAKIEDEFRDLSYECNANRLMRGVSPDRPDYSKLQDERVEECRTNTRMNQKKAENLLNYYVGQLQTALYKHKNANAVIWTKESWYLGTMRSVNSQKQADGFQQEEIKCSENMEPAEMQKLSLQQQQVEAEYAEMTAKQVLRQTTMMEQQAKAEKANADERKKKASFAEKQNERQKDAMKQGNTMVPLEGTIGN